MINYSVILYSKNTFLDHFLEQEAIMVLIPKLYCESLQYTAPIVKCHTILEMQT